VSPLPSTRYAVVVRRKWLGGGASEKGVPGPRTRLDRLAASIESLAARDEQTLRHAREIGDLRRRAACGLHEICSNFTAAVNSRLSQPELHLDPPVYPPQAFNEDGVNLIQINLRGRLLQVEFEATPELVSTEEFRIPYTLAGSIRSFNQELLEHDTIEEQLVFYCLERGRQQWRFFDARTYRSGLLDQEYLITLLDRLI
jgi:hypothetical protein